MRMGEPEEFAGFQLVSSAMVIPTTPETPETTGTNAENQDDSSSGSYFTSAVKNKWNKAKKWAKSKATAVKESIGNTFTNTKDEEERRRKIQEEEKMRKDDEMYIQYSRMRNRAKLEEAMEERDKVKTEIDKLKKDRMKEIEQMKMQQPSDPNDFFKNLCFAFAAVFVVLILQQYPQVLSRLFFQSL